MATKQTRYKGGRGNRKIGRMKDKCARYRNEQRREKNKVRKIKKHLKSHPNDVNSLRRMLAIQETIK